MLNKKQTRRVMITKAIEVAPSPFIEIDLVSMTPRYIDSIEWMRKSDAAKLMRTGRVVVTRK